MTNRFKNLDSIQLNAGVSPHGEIVTVTVSLTDHGVRVSSYQWKSKCYARLTSANAYLMHRGICREFSDENRWVPENRTKSVKRLLGDAVQLAYVSNLVTHDQHFRFMLELSDMSLVEESVPDASLFPAAFSDTISKVMCDRILPPVLNRILAERTAVVLSRRK